MDNFVNIFSMFRNFDGKNPAVWVAHIQVNDLLCYNVKNITAGFEK